LHFQVEVIPFLEHEYRYLANFTLLHERIDFQVLQDPAINFYLA
jgi:hypothetical protein